MKNSFDHLEAYAKSIRLTSAERRAMRANLVAQMPVLSPYQRFLRPFAYLANSTPVLIVLTLIFLGAGTAFAAQGALPGDAFYGVKVAVIEPAIGALQTTPAAQASWQVHLADTRLAEAQAVASSPTLATSTKAVLATRVAASSQLAAEDVSALAVNDPVAAGAAAASLDMALSADADGLAALTTSADASATPVLAAALSSAVATSATSTTALALNTPAPTAAPAAMPPASTIAPTAEPMMAPMRVMNVVAPAASSSVIIAPMSASATVIATATTTSTTTTERAAFDRASALFAHTRALAKLSVIH